MPILEINITDELLNAFTLALQVSSEEKDTVLENLIHQYILDSLYQASLKTTPKAQAKTTLPTYHSKAYNRFEGWSMKPQQTNHKIITAFFACEHAGVASRQEMRDVFVKRNPEKAPYFFENNLNSMATDAGNSHGKCFDISGDTVRFTDEIRPLAEKYRERFLW